MTIRIRRGSAERDILREYRLMAGPAVDKGPAGRTVVLFRLGTRGSGLGTGSGHQVQNIDTVWNRQRPRGEGPMRRFTIPSAFVCILILTAAPACTSFGR